MVRLFNASIYDNIFNSFSSKREFRGKNTKENYNKSSAYIIKIINVNTFILDSIIIATPFLLNLYIFIDYLRDYGIKKMIKNSVVFLIDLSHNIF